MEFIDIGANLTNRSLMKDLDGVITRAADAGVRQIVVTGTSIDESSKAIGLCSSVPGSTCLHGRHTSASCQRLDERYPEQLAEPV